MPKTHLTDLALDKLPEGLHLDTKTIGFGIRVGARRRTWIVLKGSNRTKVRIGQYPDVSLKEARQKALIELGTPAFRAATITFAKARETYLAQDKWRASTKRVMISCLNHFTWTKTLSKITHEDVQDALSAIVKPSARAHALKELRTLFNWCVPRYLERSPCDGIRMETQQSRERVLSHEELKRIWRATYRLDTPLAPIVRLLILTGQRRSEIGKLDASFIGEDRITLPAELVKNGREQVFPLTEITRAHLPKIEKGPLFPAPGLDGVIYAGFAYHLPKLQKMSETADWTLHDLRRTFATNLAAIGVPIHITEKILNHVSGTISGVAAIYNRHAYFAEMKQALEAWEVKLSAIVGIELTARPHSAM